MASFLVFRDLPGITRDQYTAAQNALARAARGASTADREVRVCLWFSVLSLIG